MAGFVRYNLHQPTLVQGLLFSWRNGLGCVCKSVCVLTALMANSGCWSVNYYGVVVWGVNSPQKPGSETCAILYFSCSLCHIKPIFPYHLCTTVIFFLKTSAFIHFNELYSLVHFILTSVFSNGIHHFKRYCISNNWFQIRF